MCGESPAKGEIFAGLLNYADYVDSTVVLHAHDDEIYLMFTEGYMSDIETLRVTVLKREL